jgi:hypothetical protein
MRGGVGPKLAAVYTGRDAESGVSDSYPEGKQNAILLDSVVLEHEDCTTIQFNN